WTQKNDTHPLNEVVFTRAVYSGAADGRFRCLGGTSTRWGGALLPFLASDLRQGNWPIPYSEIIAYRTAAEQLFCIPEGPYEEPELFVSHDGKPTHIPRLAKWPPFPKRNVFNLVENEVRTRTNLRVILNACATDFEVENGGLKRIVARAVDGSALT